MPRLVRPVSVLLAALMALAGSVIDLCGCHGDVHGRFCAEAHAAAPDHHAPTCCGHACAPAPKHDTGPILEKRACDCPVLKLNASPAEVGGGVVKLDGPTLDLIDAPATLLSVVTLPAVEVRRARPPPDPGGPRRHLLLCVLRC